MYTNICPNCGKKSEQGMKDCAYCGFAKAEIVNKVGILESINNYLVEKLSFLDYPQLYVTIIFRLAFILTTIFLLPDFISNSEFFWMVVGIFSVYGLIKEVAKTYSKIIFVYKISKVFLFAYFGAGLGNLISHAGKLVYYRFSYYFNLEFLYEQIELGNSMIIVGAIFGLIVMLITNQFRNEFRAEEYSSDLKDMDSGSSPE